MAIYLEFNAERCKGCELCILNCPKHILALADTANEKGYRPAICKDIDSCIGCASCAKICPDSVITITKD